MNAFISLKVKKHLQFLGVLEGRHTGWQVDNQRIPIVLAILITSSVCVANDSKHIYNRSVSCACMSELQQGLLG